MARFIVMVNHPLPSDPCALLKAVPGVSVIRDFESSRSWMALIESDRPEHELVMEMVDLGPLWTVYPERTYRISYPTPGGGVR